MRCAVAGAVGAGAVAKLQVACCQLPVNSGQQRMQSPWPSTEINTIATQQQLNWYGVLIQSQFQCQRPKTIELHLSHRRCWALQ